MITNITPQAAWQKLQSDSHVVLLDVRTLVEYGFLGHPTGALHVPLMESPDWKTDPEFCRNVRLKLAEIDQTPEENLSVMTLCRSGKRSETAAELLIADGFKSVFNILEGFEGDRDDDNHRSTINGWRFHMLPWEQS